MVRIARLAIPSMPHYVTQHGVPRMDAFDNEDIKYYVSVTNNAHKRGRIGI